MDKAYQPVAGSNAIDAALFILVLDSPLTKPEMVMLKETIQEAFPQDFPSCQDINVTFISIGAQKPSPPIPGFIYRDYSRSGKIAWEVKAENNAITIRCGDYSRWKEVANKARSIIDVLLGKIPKKTVIKIIHTCVDRIIFRGAVDEYNFKHIFNEKSQYLNSASSKRQPPWHLHQGFFQHYENTDLSGKWLDVLNITTALRPEGIDTFIEQVNELTFKTSIACSILKNKYMEIFIAMHNNNKSVIGDVLSKKLCKMIKLGE